MLLELHYLSSFKESIMSKTKRELLTKAIKRSLASAKHQGATLAWSMVTHRNTWLLIGFGLVCGAGYFKWQDTKQRITAMTEAVRVAEAARKAIADDYSRIADGQVILTFKGSPQATGDFLNAVQVARLTK